MESVFDNRVDAGRALAGLLGAYAGRDDVLVLGLPAAACRWGSR